MFRILHVSWAPVSAALLKSCYTRLILASNLIFELVLCTNLHASPAQMCLHVFVNFAGNDAILYSFTLASSRQKYKTIGASQIRFRHLNAFMLLLTLNHQTSHTLSRQKLELLFDQWSYVDIRAQSALYLGSVNTHKEHTPIAAAAKEYPTNTFGTPAAWLAAFLCISRHLSSHMFSDSIRPSRAHNRTVVPIFSARPTSSITKTLSNPASKKVHSIMVPPVHPIWQKISCCFQK